MFDLKYNLLQLIPLNEKASFFTQLHDIRYKRTTTFYTSVLSIEMLASHLLRIYL